MTRLLIVEDDCALRQMLCWEPGEMGYEVTATDCCSEAFAVFENSQFELALLDYNLPDGMGTSVMHHLQRIHPGLPVVLYSGRDLTEVAPEEISRDDSLYISKPIKTQALHSLFNNVLSEELKLTITQI